MGESDVSSEVSQFIDLFISIVVWIKTVASPLRHIYTNPATQSWLAWPLNLVPKSHPTWTIPDGWVELGGTKFIWREVSRLLMENVQSAELIVKIRPGSYYTWSKPRAYTNRVGKPHSRNHNICSSFLLCMKSFRTSSQCGPLERTSQSVSACTLMLLHQPLIPSVGCIDYPLCPGQMQLVWGATR